LLSRGPTGRSSTPKNQHFRAAPEIFSALARRLHFLAAVRETTSGGRLRNVIEARKVTDFTPIVAAAGAPSWVCHRSRRIRRDFRTHQGVSFVFFAVFRSHLGQSARPPAAGLRSHHFGDSLTNLVTGLVRPAAAAFFPAKTPIWLLAQPVRCPATPARRHPPFSGVDAPVRSFVVRSLFHASAAFGRPGTF
jgi:hypothetical protein